MGSREWLLCFAGTAALAPALPTEAQCPTSLIQGSAGEQLGHALSFQGTRAALQTSEADGSAPGMRAVRVFDLGPDGWAQTAELSASDGLPNSFFGTALSLDGDTLAVGDYVKDLFTGGAYVYERDASGWSEVAVLEPDVGTPFSWFARALALSDGVLVVGAPNQYGPLLQPLVGAAYVYERTGSGWVETAELSTGTSLGQTFGHAVAVSDDRILVGAPGPGSPSVGPSAHLFERGPSGWEPSAHLVPSNGVNGDRFGHSVALSGNTALIGAPHLSIEDAPPGAAYVFDRTPSGWVETAVLVPDDSAPKDGFGSSVHLSGDRALVVACTVGEEGFAIYTVHAFERAASGWTQTAKIEAQPGSPVPVVRDAVSLHGDRAMLGTLGPDETGAEAGAALVLSLSEEGCPTLFASPPALSLSAGATQTLRLRAGDGHAGEVYRLLGSASGTSPGVELFGHLVPLNVDEYTALAFGPDSPLTDPFGVLGAGGTATAGLVVPAGSDPVLAGLVLHHAYLTLDLQAFPFAVTAASNSVSVTLVP